MAERVVATWTKECPGRGTCTGWSEVFGRVGGVGIEVGVVAAVVDVGGWARVSSPRR